MRSRPYILAFLAFILAVQSGGLPEWGVMGIFPCFAEDPLAEDNSWDEEDYPTAADVTRRFHFSTFSYLHLPFFRRELKAQSELYLLNHSLLI